MAALKQAGWTWTEGSFTEHARYEVAHALWRMAREEPLLWQEVAEEGTEAYADSFALEPAVDARHLGVEDDVEPSELRASRDQVMSPDRHPDDPLDIVYTPLGEPPGFPEYAKWRMDRFSWEYDDMRMSYHRWINRHLDDVRSYVSRAREANEEVSWTDFAARRDGDHAPDEVTTALSAVCTRFQKSHDHARLGETHILDGKLSRLETFHVLEHALLRRSYAPPAPHAVRRMLYDKTGIYIPPELVPVGEKNWQPYSELLADYVPSERVPET